MWLSDGEMDGKNYTARQENLKKSFLDFSCNTTFHGLRYIADSNSLGRRWMWILTVIACVCAVGYQIVDRVMFYYSWPVNVNVQINYNKTLMFPAVTICNQNAFRASEAAKYEYYELIEDMYSNAATFSVDKLDNYGASNVSLEDLYVKLRHTKEDLIVKCFWNNIPCGPDDFVPILTDHGLCYQFRGTYDSMKVSASGTETGLRLILNVEQYEYMPGPHDAAGVKMLLHDSRETPSVHSLGQAVATGTHGVVGVKYLLVNNQAPPYGICNHKQLKHTNFYTTEECYLDCMTTLAQEECSCRDIYMPQAAGHIPICSLENYISCLKVFEEEFHERHSEVCDCPVPCELSLFEPSFSYATISNHVVRKMLTSAESRSLKAKLQTALETTSKRDKSVFEKFKALVKNMYDAFNRLKSSLRRVSEYLANHAVKVRSVHNDTCSAYFDKERLYRYQIYIIERNFLRGREAMEERFITNVVIAFVEFAMINAKRIKRLAAVPKIETNERKALYDLIVDSLKIRQEIGDLARKNLTRLYKAFIKGKRIFNYQFENIDRSHNHAIMPKPLLNYSMHHNSYILKYGPKTSKDLRRIHNALDMFLDAAKEAYINSTVNETSLNYTFERYLFSCRTFMYSKSVFYSQGVDYLVPVLKDRRSNFEKNWEHINSLTLRMEHNIESLKAGLNKVENVMNGELQSLVDNLMKYVHSDDGSKLSLTEMIVSPSFQGNISYLKDFFNEITTRGQDIFDSMTLIKEPLESFWRAILDDEDMLDYYEFTNNSRFLQNLSEVITKNNIQSDTARDKFDVREAIANEDTNFVHAVDGVSHHVEDFKETIKVDSLFVRENFLLLDIFFSQMRYEHIDQQVAYDGFALLCDIGGSLGLFIGASMLTVMEIIDLLIILAPGLFADRRKKEGEQDANARPVECVNSEIV